jgi:hypothetical protein
VDQYRTGDDGLRVDPQWFLSTGAIGKLVNHGTWYARSSEVISSLWMQWTVWLRIPGDIVFSIGALVMVFCVMRAIMAIFQQPTQRKPTLLTMKPLSRL